MLHRLKPHEVTPHSRMLAIVLFLAVVPAISFYLGTVYAETARMLSDEPVTLTLVPVKHVEEPTTHEYRGSWFSIRYPRDFIVVGETATDTAVFTSPDGTVTMSIFAPQWAGETPLLLPRTGEILVEDETHREVIADGRAYPQKTTRFLTYRAEDTSYTRSLISVKDGYPDVDEAVTHRVFEITYHDEAAYERYRDVYLAFRASLVQYSD